MAIQSMNIASRCLGTNTNVTVILPNPPMGRSLKDFYTSGEKYKVLWLLHGGGGDATEWVRYSNIERYACDRNLVVVMPSAMGSAYSNWSAKEGCFIGFNMYDYLTEELMPLVYNWFPQVSDRREDNFISGFSMGGQGAMMYAVNHPELFGAAAILGVSAVNMHVPPDEIPLNPTGKKMLMANERGELEEYLASYENVYDRFADLAKLDNPPRLLFGIGDMDISYEDWLKMRDYIRGLGLKATFEIRKDYAHNYTFVDSYIQRVLDFFLESV